MEIKGFRKRVDHFEAMTEAMSLANAGNKEAVIGSLAALVAYTLPMVRLLGVDEDAFLEYARTIDPRDGTPKTVPPGLLPPPTSC